MNKSNTYKGVRRLGAGAPKKYDGKVDVAQPDLTRFEMAQTTDEGTKLYSAIVWSVSMARQIRLVYLVRTAKGKQSYALLFSTDLDLKATEMYEFYGARFQIEFLFRDARQYTGMVDCQSRQPEALDTHVNVSLFALNLAKVTLRKDLLPTKSASFSIASLSRFAFNEHLLNLFIRKLGLNLTSIKLTSIYQSLCKYGSLTP